MFVSSQEATIFVFFFVAVFDLLPDFDLCVTLFTSVIGQLGSGFNFNLSDLR